MKQRLCQRCLKPIEKEHPDAKYCNTCRNEIRHEAWANLKEQKQKQKQMSKAQNENNVKGPSLREINEAAKAKGMSYGYYTEYLRKHKGD